MKVNIFTRVCMSILLVFLFITFFACSKSTNPDTENGMGIVSGKIYSEAMADLEGVTISIGNLSATTAANGEFMMSNVPVGAEVLVNISKPDYITTHKVIQVLDKRRTHITSTLFDALVVTIDGIQPSIITDGPASIEIPANAFVDAQGNAFTGTVLVNARYFDPTNPVCLAAFPGEFEGVRIDGTETNFESYGFFSAKFFSDADHTKELKLAPNTSAAINVPIPTTLLSASPATIPMWYYDDATGKWREEGSATKVNNYYVGSVSHFTFWNFDHPINITDEATLTGKVVYGDNSPANGAQIVAMGIDYTGYTTAYSGSNGDFSIRVKGSSSVSISARMGNISGIPKLITTPAAGSSANVDTLIIADMTFTMTGLIKDSAGQAVPISTIKIQQYNPPASALPFMMNFMTDDTGHFVYTDAFGTPGTTIQLQVSRSPFNSEAIEYSNPISFTVPYPGDYYDFGTINLLPGGILTGKAKKSTGDFFANTNIYFMQEGVTGAGEVYYHATVDSLGNFTITGPPSTTNINMRGSVNDNSQSWECALQTFNFPASGQTRNHGTIIFNLSPTHK